MEPPQISESDLLATFHCPSGLGAARIFYHESSRSVRILQETSDNTQIAFQQQLVSRFCHVPPLFPTIARVYVQSDLNNSARAWRLSEFVPGDSLHSILESKVPLTLTQQLIISYGVARALALTGADSRIVNSRNVILNSNFEPILVCEDFHCCVSDIQELKLPGVGYHRAQFLKTKKPFGIMQAKRARAYAFGVLLWALITGDDAADAEQLNPPIEIRIQQDPVNHPLFELIQGLTEFAEPKVTPFADGCTKIEDIGQREPLFHAYRERIREAVDLAAKEKEEERKEWPETGSVVNFEKLAVNISPERLGRVAANLWRRLGQESVAASYERAIVAFARRKVE
jgi:hypothetical protein